MVRLTRSSAVSGVRPTRRGYFTSTRYPRPFRTMAEEATDGPAGGAAVVDGAGGRVVAGAGGAAHGTAHLVPLNFDARTGRQYRLADLFAPGAPYLATLSQLSRPALAKQLGPDANVDAINEGTAPSEENFGAWSVSPGGLEVTFGEYQVGPYAIGMPRITLAFAALRDIIAAAGPLGGRA